MRTVNLYVDGSYRKSEPGITAGGAVVVLCDTPVCCQRYLTRNPDFVRSWNVGGELLAAIFGLGLVTGLMKGERVKVAVYYDYMGIECLVQGNPPWRAKTVCAKQYVEAVITCRKQNPNLIIEYHKVKAHTGDRWNEAADRVANGIFGEELANVRLEDFMY